MRELCGHFPAECAAQLLAGAWPALVRTTAYTEGGWGKRVSLAVDAGNLIAQYRANPHGQRKQLTSKHTRHCGTVLVMTPLR